MRLFGREYSKDEICRRVGDLSQIASIKAYTFNEGYENGREELARFLKEK